MNLRSLIERLEELADEHGNECLVFVVDGEGEYGFSVHAEQEVLGDPPRMVVYLDTTGDPE